MSKGPEPQSCSVCHFSSRCGLRGSFAQRPRDRALSPAKLARRPTAEPPRECTDTTCTARAQGLRSLLACVFLGPQEVARGAALAQSAWGCSSRSSKAESVEARLRQVSARACRKRSVATSHSVGRRAESEADHGDANPKPTRVLQGWGPSSLGFVDVFSS